MFEIQIDWQYDPDMGLAKAHSSHGLFSGGFLLATLQRPLVPPTLQPSFPTFCGVNWTSGTENSQTDSSSS
jgi:hypothetical protein